MKLSSPVKILDKIIKIKITYFFTAYSLKEYNNNYVDTLHAGFQLLKISELYHIHIKCINFRYVRIRMIIRYGKTKSRIGFKPSTWCDHIYTGPIVNNTTLINERGRKLKSKRLKALRFKGELGRKY